MILGILVPNFDDLDNGVDDIVGDRAFEEVSGL